MYNHFRKTQFWPMKQYSVCRDVSGGLQPRTVVSLPTVVFTAIHYHTDMVTDLVGESGDLYTIKVSPSGTIRFKSIFTIGEVHYSRLGLRLYAITQ